MNKERKKEGRELAWPKACPKARPGHRPSPLQLWNDCFKGCPVHLGALPPTSSDLVSCPAHRRGLANTGSHVAKSCNRSISSAPSPHRTGGDSHCWTEEGRRPREVQPLTLGHRNCVCWGRGTNPSTLGINSLNLLVNPLLRQLCPPPYFLEARELGCIENSGNLPDTLKSWDSILG